MTVFDRSEPGSVGSGEWDPDFVDLARTFARGDSSIVIGTGLSIGAGAPTADELADDLRSELSPPTSERSLARVAQFFRNQLGPYALYARLRAAIVGRSLQPTRAHVLLCRLPVQTYLTTNWDSLIEQALRAADRRTQVVVDGPDLAAWDETEVHVFKLHGELDRPDTIVIAEEDYDRLLHGTAPMRHKLLDLLAYRPVCFVGYSMRDPDIALLYSRAVKDMGVLPRPAYMLTFETDLHLLDAWRQRGVKPVIMKSASGDKVDRDRALVSTLARLVVTTRRFTNVSARQVPECDVLVVDDEPAIRLALKGVLETRLNIRVETADDGMEACLRLATLKPALILVDLHMPGMDGWRMIEVMRSDPDHKGTQFIIVSGHATNEGTARALGLDIPYLTKPFHPDELVALVEQRLAMARNRF